MLFLLPRGRVTAELKVGEATAKGGEVVGLERMALDDSNAPSSCSRSEFPY